MKFKSPLLVVNDIEESKKFYKDVLGLRVILDFGAKCHLDRRSFLTDKRKLERIYSKRGQ